MTEPTETGATPPPWQTCLDVEGQGGAHYLDYANLPLFDLLEGAPRRALDLGCAGGMFGLRLKERFPDASVVGVEPGREAAAIAATRIDRVVRSRLETLDLAAEGFHEGEFDTVIAADVLEHVVNPWSVLVHLRPFLAPGAQVVASIPNTRNLALVADLLVLGRWQYRERGLLDITHLRFFTLEEIRRLFAETGYRMVKHAVNLSASLLETYRRCQGKEKVTLQVGRLTLADVSPAELAELCAQQFLVRAVPA